MPQNPAAARRVEMVSLPSAVGPRKAKWGRIGVRYTAAWSSPGRNPALNPMAANDHLTQGHIYKAHPSPAI
eukprot:11794138-Alexandrium_andersonii.AAC.1